MLHQRNTTNLGVSEARIRVPQKLNKDALPGDKLLMLYQRLTLDARKHYLGDLAAHLDCSTQAVTRMVEIVERHLGMNAHIERGLDGRRRFYQLVSKSQSKALGFSFEELNFLATCRDLAAPYLPENVAQRITKTLGSLALHLAEGGSTPLPGQNIGFRSKGFIDYTPHQETIAALRQAIEKRRVCRVSYRPNGGGETKLYRYAPGHILAMNGTLYVQGYKLAEGSLLQDRPTTFSVHRISQIEHTGEYFNFDAADTEARQFGLNWHPPKRVQVHVAPDAADYVRDRIWSDNQAIEDHADGSITLNVTTTSEKELNAWVWSFGGLAHIPSEQNQHR